VRDGLGEVRDDERMKKSLENNTKWKHSVKISQHTTPPSQSSTTSPLPASDAGTPKALAREVPKCESQNANTTTEEM
jgi:hypothetical protein